MIDSITAIFPGTFDPLTNGHIDLVERAALLFPRVILAIAYNPNKKTLFSLDERVAMAKTNLVHIDNVDVLGFANLMADFARQHNATVLVRGVRTTYDFEYERQLAEMNRSLKPDLDTIFLMPSIATGFISSTIVKDVARHKGDISHLVPLSIKSLLEQKFV